MIRSEHKETVDKALWQHKGRRQTLPGGSWETAEKGDVHSWGAGAF